MVRQQRFSGFCRRRVFPCALLAAVLSLILAAAPSLAQTSNTAATTDAQILQRIHDSSRDDNISAIEPGRRRSIDTTTIIQPANDAAILDQLAKLRAEQIRARNYDQALDQRSLQGERSITTSLGHAAATSLRDVVKVTGSLAITAVEDGGGAAARQFYDQSADFVVTIPLQLDELQKLVSQANRHERVILISHALVYVTTPFVVGGVVSRVTRSVPTRLAVSIERNAEGGAAIRRIALPDDVPLQPGSTGIAEIRPFAVDAESAALWADLDQALSAPSPRPRDPIASSPRPSRSSSARIDYDPVATYQQSLQQSVVQPTTSLQTPQNLGPVATLTDTPALSNPVTALPRPAIVPEIDLPIAATQAERLSAFEKLQRSLLEAYQKFLLTLPQDISWGAFIRALSLGQFNPDDRKTALDPYRANASADSGVPAGPGGVGSGDADEDLENPPDAHPMYEEEFALLRLPKDLPPELNVYLRVMVTVQPWAVQTFQQAIDQGKIADLQNALLVSAYLQNTGFAEERERGRVLLAVALTKTTLTPFMHYLSYTDLTSVYQSVVRNQKLEFLLKQLLKKQHATSTKFYADHRAAGAAKAAASDTGTAFDDQALADFYSAEQARLTTLLGYEPFPALRDGAPSNAAELQALKLEMAEKQLTVADLPRFRLFVHNNLLDLVTKEESIADDKTYATLDAIKQHLSNKLRAHERFNSAANGAFINRLFETVLDVLVKRATSFSSDFTITVETLRHLNIEIISFRGKEYVRVVFEIGYDGPELAEIRSRRSTLHKNNVEFIRTQNPSLQTGFLKMLQAMGWPFDSLDQLVAIDTSFMELRPVPHNPNNLAMGNGVTYLTFAEPAPAGFLDFYEQGYEFALDAQRRGKRAQQTPGVPSVLSVAGTLNAYCLNDLEQELHEAIAKEIRQAEKEAQRQQRELAAAQKAAETQARATLEAAAAAAARLEQIQRDEAARQRREAANAQQRILLEEGRRAAAEAKAARDQARREIENRRRAAQQERQKQRAAQEAEREKQRVAEVDTVFAQSVHTHPDAPEPVRVALQRAAPLLRRPMSEQMDKSLIARLQEAYETLSENSSGDGPFVNQELIYLMEERLQKELGGTDYFTYLNNLRDRRHQESLEAVRLRVDERKRQEQAWEEAERELVLNHTPGTLWSQQLRYLRSLPTRTRIDRLKANQIVGPSAGLDALYYHLNGFASPWEAHNNFPPPTTLGAAFTELEALECADFYGVQLIIAEQTVEHATPDFYIIDPRGNGIRSQRPLELKHLFFNSEVEFRTVLYEKLLKASLQVRRGIQSQRVSMSVRGATGYTDNTGGFVKVVVDLDELPLATWQAVYDITAEVVQELEQADELAAVDGILIVADHVYEGQARQTPIMTYGRNLETGNWSPEGHSVLDLIAGPMRLHRRISPIYDELSGR